MKKCILWLILAFVLAGCDRFDAVVTPVAEKVSRAFPVPIEVAAAQGALLAAMSSGSEEKRQLESRIDHLMTVRALTCMGAARIGRLDSTADVQVKVTDIECFRKQDLEFAEWIGLRRLANTLARPALRPVQQLPAKAVIPSVENQVSMVASSGAGVVMVKNNSGRFTLLDLAGGKPLSSFQSPSDAHRAPILSPNGRLLAVPVSNRALQVVDTESGSVLWSTERYSDILAWLPDQQAIVLIETGGRKTALMDLRTGQPEPYVPDEQRLSWALELPGEAGSRLVGSANAVSLVKHSRDASGRLLFAAERSWRLEGRTISAHVPMLLRNGKFLAYLSHPDVGWLNLESGQQGTWALSILRGNGYAKFDESNIIFSQSRPGAAATLSLLDIDQSAVSTVIDIPAAEGYSLPFAPRAGLARGVNSALVIYSKAQTQDAQPLDNLIAQAQLDQQLNKLHDASQPRNTVPTRYSEAELNAAAAETSAATAAAAAASAASRGAGSAGKQAYHESLARQVRAANAASAMRDGLPRDVVERIRNGSAAGAGAPTITPMLANVPANAEVAVIGVYQPRQDSRATTAQRSPGGIRVAIGTGTRPLVLVLSSYEPVRWQLQNPGGRRISAILLSGYHESTVAGHSGANVLKIGSNYAYKLDSNQYVQLKQAVSRYVANPVRTFQGAYEASEFSVSGGS